MRPKISFNKMIMLAAVIFTIGGMGLAAQEPTLEEIPGLRERAVVMRIISRIVEQDQQVAWNSENTRVTLPGRPVGLRMVGSNLIVAVQFTPFLRPNGQHILVAQGQIWINDPDEGIRYHVTMQTIPLYFTEQVYFFPLGSMSDDAHIEIQLVLEPYSAERRAGERRSDERRPRRPSSAADGDEDNVTPP